MRLLNREVANNKNLANDLSVQNFTRVLGERPQYLGVLATLKQGYTFNALTQRLGNHFSLGEKANKYQSINRFSFDWSINSEYIKKIAFAKSSVAEGRDGVTITWNFTEKYFDKYDVIQLTGNQQQFTVVDLPRQIDVNNYEYKVRLVDPTRQKYVDVNYTKTNDTAIWVTNAFPEVSKRGYYKDTSNVTRYRNYLTKHRTGYAQTSQHKLVEDLYFHEKSTGADGTRLCVLTY
jgi:hypothetical protein